MSDEVEEFLAHYGVKGMRWGVRKKEGSGGGRGVVKPKLTEEERKRIFKAALAEYDAADKVSTADQAKALQENKAKFHDKFESADNPTPEGEKHWRPTAGQVAVGVAGAAFVGLVAYGAYKNHTFKKGLVPGGSIDPTEFQKAVHLSQLKTWSAPDGAKYLQGSSLKQEAFSLPEGHTFHRIATNREFLFKQATYSTADIDDYHRYVVGFRAEKGVNAELHHVVFRAKEEVKVPSLTDAIGIMRTALMEEKGHAQVSVEEATKAFASRSGGSWDDSVSLKFFEKLKANGFSAIVDHMDAGVIGDRPLVVIDPSKFTEKVSSKMSNLDIKTAEENLKELTGRII